MMVEKDVFVEDLVADNATRVSYFRVAECYIKQTKRRKDYMALKLADRTGEVEARVWDIPTGFKTESGAYVKVEFTTEEFRDEIQIKVLRIRHLNPDEEVNIEDFMPTSPFNTAEMWERLQEHVNRIGQAELRSAVQACLQDCFAKFCLAPAAKSKHQACLGGLLEHTLAITELCVAISEVYYEVGRNPLDQDVLIAGAVMHDIGKIFELRYDDRIDYTLEGSLIGHISMGLNYWMRFDKDVPEPYRQHIRHIILSHHGRRDWGSPVVPMTREAMIFHLVDMIDSRMGLIDTMENNQNVNSDNLTGFIREFDSQYWRPHGAQRKETEQISQGTGESPEEDRAAECNRIEGRVDVTRIPDQPALDLGPANA